MRRLKVYLDTSVISHLFAEDAPDKMQDTLKFWELVKNGEYDVIISDITLDELNECPEPKKHILADYLKMIDCSITTVDEETIGLAEKFVDFGILKQKSIDDCKHISAAIVTECDIIVSWNFKHIVNHKTVSGVKMITAMTGYRDLLIYPPSMLISGGENNDD